MRRSIDSEKGDPIDRDYETTSSSDELESSLPSSSRETSNMSEPMLPGAPIPPRKKVLKQRPSRNPFHRLPARLMRYLCFALLGATVLFILALIRMSQLDTRRLQELGDQRANAPKQWERFPFLKRYYGGIRSLVPLEGNRAEYPPVEGEPAYNGTTKIHKDVPKMKVYNPYPDYKSVNYLAKFEPVHQCFLDTKTPGKRIPQLHYYEGRPEGFPNNIMGSYNLLGLEEGICFDRYGRLGPYGHGYSLRHGGLASGMHGDQSGSGDAWTEIPKYDFRNVDWAEAQRNCSARNAARFGQGKDGKEWEGRKKKVPRTAVVVRTWDTFEYREEDILYLRSLVAELNLGTGGEYDVHLLVQLKDETIPVFADEATYQAHLEKVVPAEFRGLATLWSETQMLMLYNGMEETWARGPGLPVHAVYRGLVLALQYWASQHAEYDFVWQWEMDIRYTGHWYSLFTQLDKWTETQPRKYLWERSGRYYIPALHGSWEDFSHMVRIQTEQGTESANNIWQGIGGDRKVNAPTGDKPIWGPERPQNKEDWFEIENDPVPPTSFAADQYQWGVGEAADLITLNPMFDPEGTTWGLRDDATGYNRSLGLPPRRTALVTASRLSRRLLRTMHREAAIKKHHAFPEMVAPMMALSHGYKAVYAPHPMFVDREWPVTYLGGVVNGGRNGATGGGKGSVFGDGEHNLAGMSWFYNGGFAGNIWKRWLGLNVDGNGGAEDEVREGSEGRMCLPAMLLHPVKGVGLPVEEVVQVEPPSENTEELDPAS